jgi:hypothetical protein
MTTAFASDLSTKDQEDSAVARFTHVATWEKIQSLAAKNNASTRRKTPSRKGGTISGKLSTPVIPKIELEPWQITTIEAIAGLARLPEDWDSYGSQKIRKIALATAFRIVLEIDVEDLAAPYVYPVPGGGIQLEWCILDRELEIEVIPDGSIQFLAVLENGEEEEGSFTTKQVTQLRALVRKLIAN